MLLLQKQTRGTKEVGAIQLIGHATATEADKRYKRGRCYPIDWSLVMLLLQKQTRGTKEVGAIQLIGHAIATEADKRYKRGRCYPIDWSCYCYRSRQEVQKR